MDFELDGPTLALSQEITAAGLVVTMLLPIPHGNVRGGSCYRIQVWQPDGRLWAQATHETDEDVRRMIRNWRQHQAEVSRET